MGIRESSREALRIIIDNGLLGEMQQRVYAALCEHRPCTSSELFYAMNGSRNPTHSNCTTRLGELREFGVVKELPKRECHITGRNVIVWEIVAGALPIKKNEHKIKCQACGGNGYVIADGTQSGWSI